MRKIAKIQKIKTSAFSIASPLQMKRALPSYDDLTLVEGNEDGEIIEESREFVESFDSGKGNDGLSSEDEEFGLKAVLPVGKFNEKFKQGDTPASGEEYLCTVRTERKQMTRILRYEGDASGKSIELKELHKGEVEELEVDVNWVERYWQCYQESENQFIASVENISIENFAEISRINSSELYAKLYENSEIEPNMSVLGYLRSDQDLTEKLINCHKAWLESSVLKTAEEEVRSQVATWLQAFLTSPQISNLRQLARSLDTNHPEFKEIVLVIAKKYGQSDLIKIKRLEE